MFSLRIFIFVFAYTPYLLIFQSVNKCLVFKKGLKRPFLGNNPQKQIPKVNVNIRLQCNLSTLFHFAFILLLYLKLNFCRFICIAASHTHSRTHVLHTTAVQRSRICKLVPLLGTYFVPDLSPLSPLQWRRRAGPYGSLPC